LLLGVFFAAFSPGSCLGETTDDFGPIREFLERSVDQGVVAGGSVVVLHDGEIVFQSGFGFADLESETPFEVDTPVVVASISKPMLGTTMFRLADVGILDLQTPVAKYLPEFNEIKLESGAALDRQPIVSELLTHSSGLRHDDAKSGKIWFQKWTKGKTLEDVVKRVAIEFPFVTQPGTKFAYSGIGTDVLARIGEIVSDQPRNEMLQTHLCIPLEMKTTFYWDETGLERMRRQMPTRYYRDKKVGGGLRVYKGISQTKPNRYTASGGTIVSTAPDLLKWLQMIRSGGVHGDRVFLTPQTHSEMLQANELTGVARGGLFVRKRDDQGKPVGFGHTGSSGTNVWIDFETDTIGIMLTQTRGSDIKAFRIELERRISDTLLRRMDSFAK
tara:strand:- start:1137683 stop:1138843 length:1161 start_codon:yes stop_codon:yes gene_type:complete